MRNPNEKDLKLIIRIIAGRGLPACVGRWDCQYWPWKICPVARAGQFKGKEKKPKSFSKAIADGELWIWGCHFGKPVSLNDINVSDTSALVSDMLQGGLLPEYESNVNGKNYKNLYFLVDGIYPPWSIFVSSLSQAPIRKEKLFASAQEAMLKDVERAFGVLLSRWALLDKPLMLWDRHRTLKVIQTALILHNMVV